MAISPPCIRRPPRRAHGNHRQQERGRIGEHVRRLGQQRDRVRKETADCLDEREAAENDQCRDEPASPTPVGMRKVIVPDVTVSHVPITCYHFATPGPPCPGRASDYTIPPTLYRRASEVAAHRRATSGTPRVARPIPESQAVPGSRAGARAPLRQVRVA